MIEQRTTLSIGMRSSATLGMRPELEAPLREMKVRATHFSPRYYRQLLLRMIGGQRRSWFN